MSTLQQRRATTPATNNLPEGASPEATTTTTAAGAGAGDFNATRRARRKVKSRSSISQRGTVSWSIFVAIAGMAAIWVLIPICLIKFGYLTLPSEHPFVRHRASAPDGIVAIQDSVVDNISPRDSDVTKEKQKSQKALPNYRKLETEVIDMRVMAATLPFDDKDGGVWKQGWDLDPKKPSPDSPIKVFVVPHSHCDPGWIKTFDDYFRTQTSGIISSVVQALAKDPRRKFIWAEISYFEWWWNDQSEAQRAVVKKLLRNGQLEFVTGGWVQPDEANTELYAMEIQLQEGHDWIRQTLGEEFIPKYGWSIDPFGYSPTMAYLLQKYGFEGMLIQRVHYAVKKELASKKQLEFIWRQTWDETGEHDIFTHLMPFYSYDVPHTCGPDPSICCQFDFARTLPLYGRCPWNKHPQKVAADNVHERAMLLLDQHLKKASLYRGNAVLIPLGDDFRYRTLGEAELQYENYQTIFDYINKNVPNVQIQFGTLSEYFKEVIGTFDTPILKGAFFTYSDRAQDYWSGYFTSRVFDKALDRKLERVLYAAESLGATPKELQGPRRALSLFQHHDGVTGTAKNHVVLDYAKRMHDAIGSVQQWLQDKIVKGGQKGIAPCWTSSSPRGLTQNLCGEAKDVIVYNPLAYPQTCGSATVPPLGTMVVEYPCDVAQPKTSTSKVILKFDNNGLLQEPIQEQWMQWHVRQGGAYLFFPGTLDEYSLGGSKIENNGWVVSTPKWKRTLVQHEYSDEFGNSAIVLDFIYETNLDVNNEEWFVRFTSSIQNGGVFHTDLNGFNFDTHHYRDEMPIQSQVFPMPTLASIEDHNMRMSIISEHAQGTASLETGAIDVWLDRRLQQDDYRGLEQGVMDNVPTRTRLRVVLEKDVPITKEFSLTPLCRRMWDELNHPLEAFGKHKNPDGGTESLQAQQVNNVRPPTFGDESTPIIPIVIMVFNRVDYLKQCIDSIRNSDFNKKRVPIIISQDGDVAEVTKYIESLQDEFWIHRIVHPYSCYEHQDGFPGDKAGTLNANYAGDSYRNPREGKVTCCKHHFTWLLKTVYSNLTLRGDAQDLIQHFFFTEEDYIVGPNVYEGIIRGVGFLDQVELPPDDGGIKTTTFGLLLDPTNGNSRPVPSHLEPGFYLTPFVTGPMVLNKTVIGEIIKAAKSYCEFDDYNWDWSLVHLQTTQPGFPRICLVPSRPLVKHIGISGGMHEVDNKKLAQMMATKLEPGIHLNKILPSTTPLPRKISRKGYGGWGHPADQEHCKKVLSS